MDVVLWLPKWCVGELTASVVYVIIIDFVSAAVVVARVAPLGINGDFISSGLLTGIWLEWLVLVVVAKVVCRRTSRYRSINSHYSIFSP